MRRHHKHTGKRTQVKTSREFEKAWRSAANAKIAAQFCTILKQEGDIARLTAELEAVKLAFSVLQSNRIEAENKYMARIGY